MPRIGVSRQWLVGVERGRARAELGLLLRTLDTLGVRLHCTIDGQDAAIAVTPDIDAIVASARRNGHDG